MKYMVGEARGKELQGEQDEHDQKTEEVMMDWVTSPDPVRSGGRRRDNSRGRQAVGQGWVRCARPPTARRVGGQLGRGGATQPCWVQAGQMKGTLGHAGRPWGWSIQRLTTARGAAPDGLMERNLAGRRSLHDADALRCCRWAGVLRAEVAAGRGSRWLGVNLHGASSVGCGGAGERW